eukprot:8711492-Pyramimonas_sp.AAC.1
MLRPELESAKTLAKRPEKRGIGIGETPGENECQYTPSDSCSLYPRFIKHTTIAYLDLSIQSRNPSSAVVI